MFTTVKNNLKRAKLVKLFAVIVAATATDAGCGFLAEKDADEIAAAEPSFVEVNKAVKDPTGNVAVRATAAGIAASSQEAAAPAAEVVQEFKIEEGIALPAIKRGGGGKKEDTYPFAKLEKIGQSFVVAATDKKPNPAKSLASTVSSATRRYAEATGEQETVKVRGKEVTRPKMKLNRKFVVRAIVAGTNGETVTGARIWRTL